VAARHRHRARAFLSILGTEAPWQRFGRVVLVHAVRRAEELAYQDQIRALLAQHPGQFVFVPVVSGEDCDFALGGRIPRRSRTAPGRQGGHQTGSQDLAPDGLRQSAMVADTVHALERRGLKKHRRRDPGQISVENYW